MAAAAYNSTVHESTGKTPAEMNYPGRSIDPLSWALQEPRRVGANETAVQVLDSLRAVWSEARTRLMAEREKQAKYADQRRRPVKYAVGQMVYLSTQNIRTARGKLKERWAGPFIIKALVASGSAVKLELPAEWRVYHTFHVSLIKPYVASRYQWPGRAQQDRVVPVIVDGEVEWEIESIIGRTVEQVTETVRRQVSSQPARAGLRARTRWETVPVTRDIVRYLVKWKGYDEVEASWKGEDELANCRELIAEYEAVRRRNEVPDEVRDDPDRAGHSVGDVG